MPQVRARLSAVTIDVDSLRLYREIHGLAAASPDEDPIYTIALARFFELVVDAKTPPTLFLVGADAPRFASAFAPVAAARGEIASHSFAHDYHLSRRPPAEIRADLEAAHAALVPLSPSGGIHGFRAPGYNTSAALLSAVRDLGYTYDSSLLPSPLYFAARATAIGAYAALGRPSRSLVGDLRAFAGSLAPRAIEPDAPWRAVEPRPGRLVELPMACEPVTRAPLIGTSWAVAGPAVRRAMLTSALTRLDVVNFEMHAIDLLDASDPGVPAELAAVQRDLRVPFAEKRAAFRALFGALAAETEAVTLAELARRTVAAA
ncbi:polysaccharide deacetylase family protein [Myxococcota bacterium]|nr:polysaccharide deacetylase family protein [Myxococcota bacterium]